MANLPAAALVLREGDRDELMSWTRSTTSVWKWRDRYAQAGLAGLDDAARSGRPKRVDDQRIITATLTPPPKKYAVTHWSSRLLADHLKIGNAIVLCVDEKSQIQALDRTAPMLPMRIGQAERRTQDYKRHGTTTLFAALEIATGHVTGAVKPKHRRQEFLAFLRQIDRAYP